MEIDEAVVPEEQSVPTGHQIVVSPQDQEIVEVATEKVEEEKSPSDDQDMKTTE